MSGGGGGTGRGATGCAATGCCSDCRTASATSFCCNETGCCSVISTGEPTSRKKLCVLKINAIEATPPMARPTKLPIAVPFKVLPGVVKLDVTQNGGCPVHPGGLVLVSVCGEELATEWPISAPRPRPAAGRANAPT